MEFFSSLSYWNYAVRYSNSISVLDAWFAACSVHLAFNSFQKVFSSCLFVFILWCLLFGLIGRLVHSHKCRFLALTGSFCFLLISIPALCCMPPGLTPPALAHSPRLPPPAPPPAPPPSAQTAISDRRGAWEVQPNRQTNSSYLTSHLAADRHGGSVQVQLHPSLDSSSCVRSCLQPSAAARPTCSQTWLEHFLYGFPFSQFFILF